MERKRPRRNVPLLRKTMETIENLPTAYEVKREDYLRAFARGEMLHVWNQASWAHEIEVWVDDEVKVCGTAGCYAGWAAHIAGGKIIYQGDFAGHVMLDDQTMVSIRDYALRELGLTYEEGDFLFHGDNTLATLRDMTTELIEATEQEREPDLRSIFMRDNGDVDEDDDYDGDN